MAGYSGSRDSRCKVGREGNCVRQEERLERIWGCFLITEWRRLLDWVCGTVSPLGASVQCLGNRVGVEASIGRGWLGLWAISGAIFSRSFNRKRGAVVVFFLGLHSGTGCALSQSPGSTP